MPNSRDISTLTQWQKTAFCAALIARMIPNYRLFSDATQFGDSQLLNNQLNLMWQRLSNQQIKLNSEAQLLKLEEIIPDPQQYDFLGVYPAIDCTMAMVSLWQAIASKDSESFEEVAELSLNSVLFFIESTEDSATEEHPLLQWELATQEELINLLRQSPENKATVDKIKSMVLSEKISNLGIEYQ